MSENMMLNTLNERLKAVVKKPAKRIKDTGNELFPGQLWRPAVEMGETPTWLLLLLEILDDGFFNVVPVFRWTELAGPHDVYIPEELAGSTFVASLELESTLSKKGLKMCSERLDGEALRYLLEARRVADDEAERQRFFWGRSYYGEHSLRLDYHYTINEQLEGLQQDVRDNVYGVDEGKIIQFPHNQGWSEIEQECEPFERLLAADSGENHVRCIIMQASDETDRVKETLKPVPIWAKCESFDPLIPGSDDDICCEWFVPYEQPYRTIVGASFYVDGIDEPVGHPEVFQEGDQLHVILTKHTLPRDADPVRQSEAVKLVIFVK